MIQLKFQLLLLIELQLQLEFISVTVTDTITVTLAVITTVAVMFSLTLSLFSVQKLVNLCACSVSHSCYIIKGLHFLSSQTPSSPVGMDSNYENAS